MSNRLKFKPIPCPFKFIPLLTAFLLLFSPYGQARGFTYSLDTVSLSEYGTKAIAVSNPMNLVTMTPGATFQITHPDFILQFFFNNNNIIGMVLKRDPNKSIHVRWCFYRSCEENQLDYNATIAPVRGAPFANGFFEIKLPTRLNYHYQGMHFTSGK